MDNKKKRGRKQKYSPEQAKVINNERAKIYHQEHKDERKEYCKDYYLKNKDKYKNKYIKKNDRILQSLENFNFN